MQAYEGCLEERRFFPIGQQVRLAGRCRVIVTVLDEPTSGARETSQAAAWREFFEAVNSGGEEIPETFARVDFAREIDL